MAKCWYIFIGSTQSSSSILIVTNYQKVTIFPSCSGGTLICVIRADCPQGPGSTPPALSTRIKSYISNAFNVSPHVPQPTVGRKKYVYLKA